MTSAAAISFWNRNQKTRASTATSEDGGAVGMIELSMLRGPIRLARACFYATRNFAAQVRHRRDSSVASAANIDIRSPSLFQAIKFQIMSAFWNFVGPLLGLGARPEELTFVQISLRGVVVFIATLIMVRLGHKRSLSRKTAFDAVLLVILASVLSRAINGSAAFFSPLGGGFVLVFLHRVLALVAYHSHAFGILIKGRPDVVVEDGHFVWKQMHRNHVSTHDIEEDMRLSLKSEDIGQIKKARVERSGDVSFIPK